MGADILDDLRQLAAKFGMSHGDLDVIDSAAAEIGRLRGEVADHRSSSDWMRRPNERVKLLLREAIAAGVTHETQIELVWRALMDTAPAMPNGAELLYEAYKTWPEDIRKKLSLRDLRRMGGWAPTPNPEGWRIDTSAGGPILVYKDCSVIEGEDARYVLGLIRAADNRDAAGVDAVRVIKKCRSALAEEMAGWDIDPPIAHVKEAHDACVAWLAGKPEPTPAAVSAGEAVAADDARRHAASLRGISSHIRACPPYEKLRGDADCIDAAADFIMHTLQPADGGAVAEWQVWHEQDGWGATHPDNVAHYRARGIPVRPLYTTPPAPVQAAPQEGEDAAIAAAFREVGACSYAQDGVAGELFAEVRKRAALQHRGDSQEVGSG